MSLIKKTPRHNTSKSIAKQVRLILDGMAETKVNSLIVTGATVAAAGSMYDVSVNIAEGSDIANRSGTTVLLEQIRIYYRCFSVVSSQTFRFILFHDRFNAGAVPTVAELLPSSTYLSQFSDVRELQQHRYIILDDWFANSQISGEIIKSHVRTIKCHRKMYYNGATAVSSAAGHNALYLCVIGSSSTGLYDFRVQMMYKDF